MKVSVTTCNDGLESWHFKPTCSREKDLFRSCEWHWQPCLELNDTITILLKQKRTAIRN